MSLPDNVFMINQWTDIDKMNHNGDTNKMVSDTPRTDAHIDGLRRDPEVSGCDRTLNFCRQLERELNAANTKIKRLEEFVDQLTNPKFTRDDLPKEALLQYIKRLEDAGDKIVEAGWSVQDWSGMCVVWAKAKEAKL